MAFTERLKKVKKAAVMTWVAIMGAATSLEAQPQPVPEKTGITESVEQANTQKKKQFETAVRAGAPKKEIAKYIDFPAIIPVTQDGQFDKEKASDWAKKLAPYMETLAKKGQTISALDAYKAFKKTTGQKDVSLEDFEQVCEISKDAIRGAQDKGDGIGIAMSSTASLICAWLMLSLGWATALAATCTADAIYRKKPLDAIGPLAGFVAAGVATYYLALGAFYTGKEATSMLMSSPKREAQNIYAQLYDSYVDRTIDIQQKQFQQMEWNQVRQALSPQK